VKVDGTLGGLETAATQAAAAEAAGYDGVWSGEVSSDPFLALAVATPATSRVQLGTSIAVALARSPMTLAYTANDLQRFSGGRFCLGLGSQVKAHITRRFSMPWGKPAAQLREFVLAMRAAWSSWADGTPLRFEGEYYRHTLMPPTFVPPPHPFGPPRVLLAAVGDGMTRVAGEVADGVICHWFTTERWVRERTLPAVVEGRGHAGRTLDGFDIVIGGFVATGTDEEITQGVARMRAQIAFYASTPAYRAILDLHGWGDLGVELTALSKQNRWPEMAALIDDEVVETFGIIAAPDDLPARVAARYGDLATRLAFTPPASFTPDQIQATIAALRALPGPTAQSSAAVAGSR
jgi:probable F420-dependent oxidoreductase